ncbi:MAG: hypothetical protein ACI9LM_003189 [Alteromonadaceae bacterium]
MFKLSFAIFLFFVTCSNSESGYSIADEINADTSSLLIFDVITDIELDSEHEPLITDIETNNRINQRAYLAKYSTNKKFIILNNKFQYSRPRAPPFNIV